MGTTPNHALPYPDGLQSEANVPRDLRALAERLDIVIGSDETVTAAVPARTNFTSTLVVVRWGPLVKISGSIIRTSGTGTGWVNCADIPDGYKPMQEEVQPTGLVFGGSGVTYQFNAKDDGVLDIRISATTALGLTIATVWITEDTWPA